MNVEKLFNRLKNLDQSIRDLLNTPGLSKEERELNLRKLDLIRSTQKKLFEENDLEKIREEFIEELAGLEGKVPRSYLEHQKMAKLTGHDKVNQEICLKIFKDEKLTKELYYLDFGIVKAGTPKTLSFFLYNASPIQLTSIRISHEDPTFQAKKIPKVIPPFSAVPVEVVWTPLKDSERGLKTPVRIEAEPDIPGARREKDEKEKV